MSLGLLPQAPAGLGLLPQAPAGLANLAARLEAWEPQPLRHPVVRAGAVVWASPISAVGLLVGLVSAAPARVREGVLLFAPLRGVPARVLRRRGFTAAAFGHVVLSLPAVPPASLLAHELV